MPTKPKKRRASLASPGPVLSARGPAPKAEKSAPKRAVKAKKPAQRKAPAPSIARTLLRSWPPLGEAHRQAFRSLASEQECERLGERTKSEAVLREASAWAPVVDRALRDFPYELRRYAPARFVWFLESVRGLEDATQLQASGAEDASNPQRSLNRAVLEARGILADLAVALEVVATGRPDGVRRVEAAHAAINDAAQLPDALRAVADLADEYGQSYDMTTKALVASVALRAEDAHAARNAASRIDAAKAALATGTRVEGEEDLPNTNRNEGRVLFEMRFVKRMFNRAREVNPRIPGLSPGPGTRIAFG